MCWIINPFIIYSYIYFRDFRLILTPKKGLLHHQFEATTVDAEGNETPVAIGKFKLY